MSFSGNFNIAHPVSVKILFRKHRLEKSQSEIRKFLRVASKLTSRIAENKGSSEDDINLKLDCAGVLEENVQSSFPRNDIEGDLHRLNELSTTDPPSACDGIGNFPSPRELAKLDESFLAKHCNLGYRAGRILKLAQGIVDGKIQLRELEDMCNEASQTAYGFGRFTRNSVLVCIGFYHVIPTDSEPIRHLKQVNYFLPFLKHPHLLEEFEYY